MRFRFARFRLVFTYVGSILFVFGLVMLVPLIFALVQNSDGHVYVRPGAFAIPAVLSLIIGAACNWLMQHETGSRRFGTAEAMLVCVFSWIAISAVGAIPFSYELDIGYIDAYFEAMSGFTTTGITMLSGLDDMPKSLLFWRSLTQWIGGLGILSFFMFVVFQGGATHRLFGAESHKIGGGRVAPGMWNTLKILWTIYLLYTVLIAGLLYLCGTTLYDAVNHSFTAISTGGYSPYDASIAHYEDPTVFPHYRAIEYVLIFGMWAGGTNFLVHYRLLTGKLSALWDSAEVRAWWLLLLVSLALVVSGMVSALNAHPPAVADPPVLATEQLPAGRGVAAVSPGEDRGAEAVFRHGLFQVMAVATTTGFGTKDIADERWFSQLTRQVFLILMFIGGCAGSTGGGFKVIRIVILLRLMARQVRKTLLPARSVELVMIDGAKLPAEEAQRTTAIFFAWLFLLVFGSIVTAALSAHGALESSSGMFSALGNIGPCYISVADMARLHPITKIVYIAGMLAGRLEIIPLLILFSGRAWK